jgi:hypothetical protein
MGRDIVRTFAHGTQTAEKHHKPIGPRYGPGPGLRRGLRLLPDGDRPHHEMGQAQDHVRALADLLSVVARAAGSGTGAC